MFITQFGNEKKYCIKCNVILTNKNWYFGSQKQYRYICKGCQKIYRNKYQKEYYKINNGAWKNKLGYNSDYMKTSKGKLADKRRASKKRGFESNPLNIPFINSQEHHLDKTTTIYVPIWINKIPHNVRTGKNMGYVNACAYFFLLQQNIGQLKNLFK